MEADTLGSTLEANKSALLRKKGVIGVARGKDVIVVFQDRDIVDKEWIPQRINGIPVKILKTSKFTFLDTDSTEVTITVKRREIPVPEITDIKILKCTDHTCTFRISYTPPVHAGCDIHVAPNYTEHPIEMYEHGYIEVTYYWDYDDILDFVLWLTCNGEKGGESKSYGVDIPEWICGHIKDPITCSEDCFWYDSTCRGIPRVLTETPDRLRVWNPFPPGVGIAEKANPIPGTFGCVVIKDGKRMMLSNRHVLAQHEGVGDIEVVQGSKDNIVGIVRGYTHFHLPPTENYADGAIAEPYNANNMLTEILDESNQPTIIPTGITETYIGQRVLKSGARTGVVDGEVIYVDASVIIATEFGNFYFKDVILTSRISKGGDSGSLLLEEGTHKAVGLVFAATEDRRFTMICKIDHILSALGCTLDTLPTIKGNAMFLIHTDPQTGDETVEVHPYILLTPKETTPVFGAIVNTGNEPIAADMWEVFGGIELPPHKTPVIPVGETIDFDYMTTRPDLPLGQYECVFYLGQHDKDIIYDEFTEPAIIIVDHCINAKSTELTIHTPVYSGQIYTGVLCVDVLSIDGAESAFADIWVCRDGDKTWEKMKAVGMTIVDRRLWPLLEETRIGLARTETLYPGNHYCLEFNFTIPTDWAPGTYELELYFGEWDQYFIYWGPVTRSFTVEVTEEPEVDGTVSIPASDIPTTLYQRTSSVFDMAVINTGTVKAEYQVAITFAGIDIANEEVFWSAWSDDVAPNGSITLPVPMELSERAIPEGAETAEYNINTKLVAR